MVELPKDNLVEFYGDECTHCNTMKPLVEKLEKEEGVTILKLETWHNDGNAKIWKEMDGGFCGGVPLFINQKTGEKICGAVDFDKLKAWALGK